MSFFPDPKNRMDEVIDLTFDDDIDELQINDKSQFVYEKQSADESRFIPHYLQVPVNFVPVCPSFSQSSRCDAMIEFRGRESILNNLAVFEALCQLDSPNHDIDRVDLDLEAEIFKSGKTYFLCKLLEHLAKHDNLTDIQVLVLTADPITEKLLFRVFREYYGHHVFRMTRLLDAQVTTNSYTSNVTVQGVGIHLTETPHLTPATFKAEHTDFIINYDACLFPKVTQAMQAKLGIEYGDPLALDLCTIGSSEFRLKEFLTRTKGYRKTNIEIVINHATKEMYSRFMESNTPYSAVEFVTWNNAVAQQVADWIMDGEEPYYCFTLPQV